jgi:hypothetical protein
LVSEQKGKRLMNIPLDEWSGADATRELQRAIERIEKENGRQSRLMLGLTAIAAVAAIIAAVPVVQAWLR